MSQKAPWLVLSAFVLVAAVLYAVLGTGGSPSGTPGNATAPQGAAEPLQGEVMVADTGETGAATDAPSMERQQVEAPPIEATGSIRVEGRLVHADGRPAAGRELSLRQLRQLQGLDLRVLEDLPDLAGTDRERTSSEEDGRFSFLVEPGNGGMVRLEEEDWILPEGTVSFQASTADVDLGDLQVVAAGILAGVVLDPSGRPVEGVNVRAAQGLIMGLGDGGRTSVSTNDRGEFRIGGLRPGEYHVRTASPAYLPRDEPVALAAGERREDLVLSLEQGQAVAGQVVDDLGRPVAGINVAARRRSTPAAGMTMERFTPAEATVTDDNGLFTLSGLDGEDATIRAWGDGYADATETGVAIGTSNLVLQLQRLAVITGVLVDESGAPISGSVVRASASRGGNAMAVSFVESGGRATASRTTTEEDGSFRLENVQPGALTLTATGDTHRPAELPGVVVGPGGAADGLRLVATRGASVAVEVLDHEGRPVPNADVRVVEPPARPQGGGRGGTFNMTADVRIEQRGGQRIIMSPGGEVVLGRGRTDSEGKVVIGGLPDGIALVKASHLELIAPQPGEVSLPVSGTVETRLTMSPGGFADLEVFDADGSPLSGAQYTVNGPEGGADEGHAGRTDGVGAARVGPLAPGLYSARLQLQGPGRSMGSGVFVSSAGNRTLDETRTEFTVRPGEETAVKLMKPVLTTFSGTVFDASGPVSGAVVQLRRSAEGDGTGRRGPRGLSIGGGGTFQATSGSDGSFEIPDLSHGAYTVEYGRPTQVVKARLEVQLSPGQTEEKRDLRLAGGTLRITVMSADKGGPLEGARVEVVRPGAGSEERQQVYMMAVRTDGGGGGETMTMEMGGSRVMTDADGVAVIDAVPPGNYSLRVTHTSHVQQVVADQTVRDGQVTDAGVANLVLGGDIRGQVLGAVGAAGILAATVEYRPVGGDGADQETAPRGNFHLEGLRPGKYLIRAQDALGDPSAWGPEEEVEVRAGQTATVSLRLPR